MSILPHNFWISEMYHPNPSISNKYSNFAITIKLTILEYDG